MRSRSILVVLSLLAIAVAPAEAGKNTRNAKRTKTKAQQKITAKKTVAPPSDSHSAGTLGATRRSTTPTGTESHVTPRRQEVAATTTRTAPKKTGRQRTQSRPVTTPQHRDSTATPAIAASRSFDSSAAVAPRKKAGKVKRFFAGIAVAAALTLGAVGWQSADMNSKVGDAWNYVTDHISQVVDGGGGGTQDPKIPPSDPGPPIPDPKPDPNDPKPDPNNPKPNGGSGHHKPHHPPETDHRR